MPQNIRIMYIVLCNIFTHQNGHKIATSLSLSYLLPPPVAVVSSASCPQLLHSAWRGLSQWEELEYNHCAGHWNSGQLHEQLLQLKGEGRKKKERDREGEKREKRKRERERNKST